MDYLVKVKFDSTFVETWGGDTVLENGKEEWLISCASGLITTKDKNYAKVFESRDEAEAVVAECCANRPECNAWVECQWFDNDDNFFIMLWKKMKYAFEYMRRVSHNF